MNRPLGLSVSLPLESVFASGLFECIEYSIGANFNLESGFDDWEKRTEEMKALCRKYNVKMRSYHLPFNGERFNGCFMHAPAALDEGIRERTFKWTKRLIDGLSDMGIEILIIHGSLRVEDEDKRDKHLECFIEYLRRLADYCKPLGISIAVETLLECCIGGGGDDPENRIREMRRIMEGVNRDNVGICLDNNHFIKSDPYTFLEELGQYVITTHFSDYDGVTERHNFPGDGITDWKRITSLLIEKGYKGPWVFEVSFGDAGHTLEKLNTLVNSWKSLLSN